MGLLGARVTGRVGSAAVGAGGNVSTGSSGGVVGGTGGAVGTGGGKVGTGGAGADWVSSGSSRPGQAFCNITKILRATVCTSTQRSPRWRRRSFTWMPRSRPRPKAPPMRNRSTSSVDREAKTWCSSRPSRTKSTRSMRAAVRWFGKRPLGDNVHLSSLQCGNIDPLGVTGTPVIDAASRTMFVDAMTTPDGGKTKKHLIFALSLDDGTTRAGWPVDVSATAKAGTLSFDSSVQNQRAALLLLNGILYVPYGGNYGDCGGYHGWVVGVPINNPTAVKGYATQAPAGGIWGVSGPSTDGTSVFVATGNTYAGATWGHGEAVLKLQPGPVFSGQATDYFAPSDWKGLDNGDADLGGTNPIVVDVPGATPSKLVVALGKNGVAYLVDRTNLGGIGKGNGTTGEAVYSDKVSSGQIHQRPRDVHDRARNLCRLPRGRYRMPRRKCG